MSQNPDAPYRVPNPRNPLKMLTIIFVILSIFGAAMFWGAYQQYQSYLAYQQPTIDASAQFVMLVGSGQVSAAKGMCTDAIDEAKLTETAEQMAKWGTIRDVNRHYGGKVNSADDIEVQTELAFSDGNRIFVGHWKMIDGSPRLKSYEFTDAPAATTKPSDKTK